MDSPGWREGARERVSFRVMGARIKADSSAFDLRRKLRNDKGKRAGVPRAKARCYSEKTTAGPSAAWSRNDNLYSGRREKAAGRRAARVVATVSPVAEG